jgi:hypothetical protein
MRSANIDFTRKDKEGGECRAPDCLSVRLLAAPRGPMTSSKLLTSFKMAGGYYKLLNPRECSIFIKKKVRFGTVFIGG